MDNGEDVNARRCGVVARPPAVETAPGTRRMLKAEARVANEDRNKAVAADANFMVTVSGSSCCKVS